MAETVADSFRPLGDRAVRVEFGREISPDIHARVQRFCMALERDPILGVIEWVPAYATVAVYYQPSVMRYETLCSILEERLTARFTESLSPARVIEIPVRYDGPDLDFVAAYHKLSHEEVIALHAAPTYRVYLLGFLPGFPYLGGLPEALATPRRDTPRLRIAAGSVGIA
ncbi:MAG: allophanate hydrolase subunit 1, partial [Armatimonadota bacterium]|nr:allophanate hydrolase subunit 1 [Armatimonadota bacterium]